MRSSGNHDSEGPLTRGLRSRCRREAAAARPDTSAQACAGPGVRHGPRGGSGHRVGGPAASWSWGRRRAQRRRRSSRWEEREEPGGLRRGPGLAWKEAVTSPLRAHSSHFGVRPQTRLHLGLSEVLSAREGGALGPEPLLAPTDGEASGLGAPLGPREQGLGTRAPLTVQRTAFPHAPVQRNLGGMCGTRSPVWALFLRWFRPQNFSLDSTCLGVPQG